MTETSEHPFYPLSPDQWLDWDPSRALNANPRTLFHALINIGSHYAWLPDIKHFLAQHLRVTEKHHEASLTQWNGAESLAELAVNQVIADPSKQIVTSDEAGLRLALTQAAPVLLTEPCWLKSVSQAATGQTELAAGLTGIYLLLQGISSTEQSLDRLYQSLLLNQAVTLPAIYSTGFAQFMLIPDEAFTLASVQLALACFPRTFFAETLGFSLAYCQRKTGMEDQLQPSLYALGEHYFSCRRIRLQSQIPPLLNAIKNYLEILRGYDEPLAQAWRRIQCGYYLYADCSERMHQPSPNQIIAQEKLALLLSRKAKAALGHHAGIQLGGRLLDHWFAESPFDAYGFLTALKASQYYNADDPGKSSLLKLFSFEGPMFGVMNADEMGVLKTWLTNASVTDSAIRQSRIDVDYPAIHPQRGGDSVNRSNRELFYQLLNTEQYPDILPIARNKVLQVLRSAKRWQRPILKSYSQTSFETWFDAFYQHEMAAYQPLTQEPRLSREAYVFGIEQFAPAILTDGCWLQQCGQLDYLPFRPIGEKLQRIFYDEIGAGIRQQNHPYIYDRLLKSLAIHLPPVQSKAFSEYQGFLYSAFDLPVFMMAIGFFPVEFLPELLGLNLAIELSGLGKTYLRLADELEFRGIDPAIVKLHITIDNVDTGHAALAKESIKAYLDDIGAGYGEPVKQQHWRRIAAGYASLNTATRRFKWALVAAYLRMMLHRKYAFIPSVSG